MKIDTGMIAEKYKQAFSTLHAAGNISWEEGAKKSTFRPRRRLASVALCAALLLALCVSVYAYGGITKRIFGWGNNLEITQETDAEGNTVSITILHTDALTDLVTVTDGKMIFIVNGEAIDITDQVSQTEAFHYEYTDEEGSTHLWLVGLNSPELENYGYAMYIRAADGTWLGGCSARVNCKPDGSTEAEWLERGRAELKIPW